ncbi:hypothetical protein [Methylobacterium brachiatum]|uniref:hypothetical protein n=1 Tax=Methylobacterium brachiatum TaxID=269660 RepID=UPI0013CE87F2|nr:hypothetical protein [Methylobacterium brachiatum]
MISAYTLDHLRDEARKRCPRCWGRGYVLYERDNPMAAEPCGCTEPAEDEDTEAETAGEDL